MLTAQQLRAATGCTAARADEWHGQTNDRKHAEVHAGVLEGVGKPHGDDADHDQSAKLIASVEGDKDPLEEQQGDAGQQQDGAAKSEFLSDDSEDEVVDGLIRKEHAVDGPLIRHL